MTIRLLYDADGLPHIAAHGVTEQEVADVLAQPIEDRRGTNGTRVASGQTRAGRYLKVVYVVDPVPDSVFIITAYSLDAKPLRGLKRRRRRRNR